MTTEGEQDGFWGVGDALTQYESAIREPYEALVKAAGTLVLKAHRSQDNFDAGYMHVLDIYVENVEDALESLGGRKDG